jgi:Uma2 family endonuclease
VGLPKAILTEDEYLKFERAAEERHQYVDGEIFAMAGESEPHSDIFVNIVRSLGNQTDDIPSRVKAANSKVRSGPLPKSRKRPAGLYSYPDVFVVCDETKYLDEFKDVILNPTAIVEILSESTEAFDRGLKFTRFQQYNPTLTDYVLVSQDRAQIEHYHREAEGAWIYRRHEGLKVTVNLPSIKCRLKASEVYKRVTFDEPPD